MNKKVLTLCAGFLLAGSLATVNAAIDVISNPQIGSSYVLGTGASEKAGTLNWVNDGLSVVANTEVTGFGTEWTLVQYVDADNKEVEGQFILQSPDGQYLASAGNNGQAKLVDDKDLAIVFNLKSKKYAEVVSDPQSQWTAGWYLTAAANGGLQGAAYSSGKPQSGYDRVQFVTFFTNKTFSADDLALVSSIDANEYYIVATNTADGKDGQVLKYDETTKSVSLVSYSVAANLYGDAYDACLWKVSSTTANNVITYTFESRLDSNIKYSYTTNKAYANGFNLVDAVGSPAIFDGDEIVALYKSPVIYKTAAELNAILTNGFEMTIKKNKDDNSVISGIDAFSGKLTAIPNNNNTRFQIINEDEEYLVLNTKANWGTGNVGVNDRGHKFEWVKAADINKADYRSYFEFSYYAGAADEKIVKEAKVYDASGNYYGSLFIQTGTENSAWLTTSNGIASTGESWPYIILQSDNIVKINEVNERFLTFTYADTKVNAGNAYEVYKYGGILVAEGEDDGADYVDATTVYEKAPEAQWAVTGYDESTGLFTLSNRESQETITDVRLRWEDKDKGICTVMSGNENFDDDLVKMTVVTDPDMFDGFAKYNESELRNNKFYLGQYHGVAGNSTAYFVENHGNSHKIGMTAEEDAAGKWNLRFATREVEVDGKTQAVVDTMFVTTTFYTLKADGTQETDANKINKSKLAILPYAFQNADNREYVEWAGDYGQKNVEYYFCYEDNKEHPEYAARFALKKKANNTYNFVEITNVDEDKKLDAEDKDTFKGVKVYASNSDGNGSLERKDAYTIDENALMVVEPVESPEYHLITNHAWGDTIRLFRGDNDSQVLYEKKDAKSVVSNDTLSFLNVDNTNQFDVNPSMFADTAYVNRWDADGIKNTCYQYLLAVQPEFGYHVDNCNNPAHKPDVTNQIDTVYCRFLINLIDTAKIYAINNIHNNPYITES